MYINRSPIFGWRAQNQKSAFWILDFGFFCFGLGQSSLQSLLGSPKQAVWILDFAIFDNVWSLHKIFKTTPTINYKHMMG